MNPNHLASTIVKLMKEQNFNDNSTREARAVFVAQTISARIKLNLESDLDAQLEEAKKVFLPVLNAVNEFLPVDVALAKLLFERTFKVRWELAAGSADPVLLQAALASASQQQTLSGSLQDVTQRLAASRSYRQAQEQLAPVVLEYLHSTAE